MCFKRERANCTQNGSSLKLVDNFMYFDSSVLSIEIDFNIHPVKACDKLSIIWKFNQSVKIKLSSSGCGDTTVCIHNIDAGKKHRGKTTRELRK